MGIFDNLGWDDLLSIPTGGTYSAVKAGYGIATGGDNMADDIGEGVKDFSKVGTNNFQAQPYQVNPTYWGGHEGAAGEWADVGMAGMAGSQANAKWAQGQMKGDRGPQAVENADLVNREASSRYGDQSGAIQLAREAAMGQAPSEAAWQQQQGLNQAMGAQSALAGSARGAAGIARAGTNAMANTAGLQQNAYMQGGQLRAKEMADARGLYGGLSGQQREQDLQRLGMGNQMSQYNAGLNDQYKLGMGQLGLGYGNQGLGWYQAGQSPYNQQQQADLARESIASQSYDSANMVNAGVSQANADLRRRSRDEMIGFASGALDTAGKGMAGSKFP